MNKQRQEIKIVPDDISNVFQANDMSVVWGYLERTFKISPKWKAKFKEDLAQQPKHVNETEYFFKFLKTNLEPALFHTTQKENLIFKMARYLFKSRISNLKEEKEDQRKFYRKNS